MRFKTWLESSESDAELYFSIGHGNPLEDNGEYVVWALVNGEIQSHTSGTHGSRWGHNITDKTYKGRYEPQTGRISIVKPDKFRYVGVPQHIMDLLHHKFDYITKVYEF